MKGARCIFIVPFSLGFEPGIDRILTVSTRPFLLARAVLAIEGEVRAPGGSGLSEDAVMGVERHEWNDQTLSIGQLRTVQENPELQ